MSALFTIAGSDTRPVIVVNAKPYRGATMFKESA